MAIYEELQKEKIRDMAGQNGESTMKSDGAVKHDVFNFGETHEQILRSITGLFDEIDLMRERVGIVTNHMTDEKGVMPEQAPNGRHAVETGLNEIGIKIDRATAQLREIRQSVEI